MSERSYPQAFSYVCKLCGKLTASRSRWHVENQVCSDGDCAARQTTPEQPKNDPDADHDD